MRRMVHTAVRAGSAFTAVLLLTAVTLAPPTSADPEASQLAKSAQNVTSPGADPANHGDTLNWVLDYTDNGPGAPATATITDPITGAGAKQTFVPGSLDVPPGWSPSWSTDGTTFLDTDPGALTSAVRATNPNARPGGTHRTGALLPPVQALATPVGGDGYTPILHRTAAGKTEVWNTFHHTGPAAGSLVCTDLSTGALCTGGPWPKALNTAPGPFQPAGSGDIITMLTPQFAADPANPAIVFYPALTSGSVGVGCLDLAARENCGYTALINTPTAWSLAGLVAQGGNLYGTAANGQVLCMAIAGRTPCAGQPYAAIVPPSRNAQGNLYLGSMTVADGKIFASSSDQSNEPMLGCFDPAAGASCAGWAAPKPLGLAPIYTYNAFTYYDHAGVAIGACSTLVVTGGPSATCYTLAGAALPPPPVFGAGVLTFNPETVTTPDGHLRSYFGIWGGTQRGATVCMDWTTGTGCANFPATHPTVNSGFTRDYGYAYDTSTECLVGLGDGGYLFSVDPVTGSTPCIRTGVTVALNPAAFYCDGGDSHVQGYQSARLENINLANVNLAASTVDVTDTGGGLIASPSFAPDGTIDLSGISVTDHPDISVSAHLVLNNDTDFTDTNHPTMTLTYQGDAPQVCFKTTIATDCSTTDVTNTATVTDATGTSTSNPVTLAVAPGSGCQPKIVVNKEICASHHSYDCRPGGPGPWVKKAPVGLLGLLFAHPRWRITITNVGAVGISNAKVNDAAEPSCATAAGTFTLAAGASKQVFCDTSILVSLLPMTNKASVTYVPANSPPGTPPTTTEFSSAVACSLLCIL